MGKCIDLNVTGREQTREGRRSIRLSLKALSYMVRELVCDWLLMCGRFPIEFLSELVITGEHFTQDARDMQQLQYEIGILMLINRLIYKFPFGFNLFI